MAGSPRPPWRLYAGVFLLLGTAVVSVWIHRLHVAAVLLETEPTALMADPDLVRQAVAIGRPQYERRCVGCHGGQLQGDPKRGVPDLAKNAWLYGNNPVDVERTILYGIRSGHPMSRNLTDMPALVRTGQITTDDAHDAIEYLQKLAGNPRDEAAALRGRSVYYNNGNCYDCHADDARGVIEYGAPALSGPVYLYGGDRETLYQSILNGRHGMCPAWVNELSALQIRALAIYLVTAPQPAALPRN